MSGTAPDDNKLLRVLPLCVVAIGVLAAWTLYAARWQVGPARCPPGAVALGARCCGTGQSLEEGVCIGVPRLCPEGHLIVPGEPSGCTAKLRRLGYRGGQARFGIGDWEPHETIAARSIEVGPFELDATEMTLQRWRVCVRAGVCVPRPGSEPGLPVSEVTPEQAERCCAFFGGRLPTGDEWLFAAMGQDERRFPWGQTGLVCRRAAFGLVRGPCAVGAAGPDLVGFRPEGATPEGALDMAGNVAEWTREPGGSYLARGGSYRSRSPSELKSWTIERPSRPARHIGFRCAYDVPSAARSLPPSPSR
jgi:formylglycine-generating enzyme